MDCNNLTDLLEEVHSQVDMLQKAVAQVSQVKASLKTTASEVKSQIRDSVSRHLEALRNRETWLLGQVEVVQHIKEDVLRQQQAELNKALGRLQSTCSLLEQSSKALDTDSLECRVRESLESVGQLSLIPEESSAINFVARNFELQDSIHKYGVVISDHPFADKQMVSSCERLQLSSGKKLAFFTPSGSCEDWLMKTNSGSACQDIPKSHAVMTNIQDWLQPKEALVVSTTESSVTSMPQQNVENWLAKCQSQDAVKDIEDIAENPGRAFAVAENKATEIHNWLLKTQETNSPASLPPTNLFDYYRVVRLSESSKWLKSNAGSAKGKLSTSLIGDTYSKIAASSPDKWLMQRKLPIASSSALVRSMSSQSCSECSCGLSSVCCDADAQEKSANFDDTSSEFSDWLAVKRVGTSRSSSPERVSTEVAGNDTWLMKQHGEISQHGTMDVTGIKNYRENLTAQPNEHWLKHEGSSLLPDNNKDCEGITSGMKTYIDSLPVDYNQWLLNPREDDGLCKWLARRSSEKCKECPRMCSNGLFKIFGEVSSSKDGWLMSQELY